MAAKARSDFNYRCVCNLYGLDTTIPHCAMEGALGSIYYQLFGFETYKGLQGAVLKNKIYPTPHPSLTPGSKQHKF